MFMLISMKLFYCLLAVANLLLLVGFDHQAVAQANLGPNAGFIQNGMMWPGYNRYGRTPDMFYGPVSPAEAGLPPKGYEKPVIIQDGVISGQIMNPTRKPLEPAKQP
jgi:hypothetical protein